MSHLHEIFIYIYIYELFIALFVLLFVHYCNVMVYVVYCVASGKQEKVQACLVTFIISCRSLYKTTLGSLCSWKPAWSLKKRPHSMCFKPFVKMCIFVVIQIFWSLRKYREQSMMVMVMVMAWWWWWWWWSLYALFALYPLLHQPVVLAIFPQYWYRKTRKNIF